MRRFYFRHTLKYVRGRAIDFGCGVGGLLKKLLHGSLGYELNESSVQYCSSIGLNVELYRPEVDKYQFSDCQPGRYKTFILNHVLEHLEKPDEVLRLICQSSNRLGIERIIVVVPGLKGFHYDKTHRTFIDSLFFKNNDLMTFDGYAISQMKYFPLNVSCLGKLFTHHELMIVYDKVE